MSNCQSWTLLESYDLSEVVLYFKLLLLNSKLGKIYFSPGVAYTNAITGVQQQGWGSCISSPSFPVHECVCANQNKARQAQNTFTGINRSALSKHQDMEDNIFQVLSRFLLSYYPFSLIPLYIPHSLQIPEYSVVHWIILIFPCVFTLDLT